MTAPRNGDPNNLLHEYLTTPNLMYIGPQICTLSVDPHICLLFYTISLERVDQMRDLGVLIDERLALSNHIQDKINRTYAMLGVIKRNFKYLQLSSFILLYKNMVRSHLDYCSSVWTPYKKGDIEDLEKVQKRATRLLPELKRI